MKSVLVGAVDSTRVALEVMSQHGVAPSLLITLPAESADIHSDFVDLAPLAHDLGVDVLYHKNVNAADCMGAVRSVDPDHIFVIGWSRLCSKDFLALARKGAIGFHPTLLPLMRGRSALAWTILLGLYETGSTLFWIDEGTDTGAIAAQARFGLSGTEYLSDLIELHMQKLGVMLADLLTSLQRGRLPSYPQDDTKATYLALRRPDDGRINWRDDADTIWRLVRAVSRPYPGAFAFIGENKFRIWRARPANFSNWFALEGQIFTTFDNCPVVRCGNGTSLVIEEYEIENPNGTIQSPPAIGNQRKLT